MTKIDNQQRNNNSVLNIDHVIDLYNKGYSQLHIGKIYNVSISSIRYYLIMYNLLISGLIVCCIKIR